MRNLKRALSLAVASVMLLGMMVVGTGAAGYPDVSSENNQEAIEVMQAVGVMTGDDQGNFNPDQQVTRGEMAVVMCKLLNLTPGGTHPFTDVPDWANGYVAAMYANGITGGTSATTYGTDEPVTAVQGALMVMKALGYFGYQGEFGSSWELATIKKANEIGLYDGVSATVYAPLTRNDVAQLALNALESDVMIVNEVGGVDVSTGDGTNVNVRPTYTYTEVQSKKADDYRTVSADQDAIQQLCEKLYGKDLKKATGGNDNMGRPATEWTYDGKSIGKYAEDADKVYTAGVTQKDVYGDLNLNTPTNFALWVDGKETNSSYAVKNDKDTDIGKKGQVVEVYKDDAKIVVTNYYIGQVDAVDENDDGERIVKVASMEYVTNAFEEDDWVIYTMDSDAANADKIQTMVLAEKLTGDVTKKVGSNEVYVDGVKYTLSASAGSDFDTYAVKDTVDYYVDANGYIIKIEVADTAVTLDNLAYVIEADTARGAYAVLRLADGSKMTVDTDKEYSTLVGHVVTFKEGKDGYELTDKSTELKHSGGALSFEKGKANINQGSSSVVTANNKTVFVYVVDGDIDVYTGFKSAPSFTSTKANSSVAYYAKTGEAASLVYVILQDSAEITATSSDMTYIANDGDVKVVDEGDGVVYYEYNAVVDGEITTIKLADKLASGDAVKIYKSVNYNTDDIGTPGTPADLNTDYKSATTSAAERDGVVTLGGTVYAYTDDVQVFSIDDDFNITAGDIGDVRNDDNGVTGVDRYQTIYFTLNDDGAVEFIILVEK